jgi:hypothetical protein
VASFTESATLKVIDQSTAQLRKINAELKKLMATARSLKSVSVKINVNVGNLRAATAQLTAFARVAAKLKGQTVNVRVNPAGLGGASAALSRLQAQAARGITVRTRYVGGTPPAMPPGGGGRPGVRYGGGGYGRTPGQAFIGGFGGGLGVGLGRLNENFGLVAMAAYGAAKALKAIGEAAYARDRAELAVDTQSSAKQQEVFKQLDAEAKARGEFRGALKYKTNQFILARASLLGDVGNSEEMRKIDPKLTSEAAQIERAQRADLLTRHLYRDFVPGMYARNPNLTQEQSQEELKKLSQILQITTQKMYDKDAQGNVVLSEDFKRVAEGLRLAQIGAPDLTLAQMKTAAASIKSLGYSATKEQIAEIMFNVSAKGQRAANEAYQAYKTGLGVTDVGKLNTAIDDLGLFLPGTAKRHYTKKNPQGLVRPSTGIPKTYFDAEGAPVKLGERSSEWWRLAMQDEEVQKKAKAFLVQQAVGALGKGATKAQKAAAAAEVENKYREKEATAVTDVINRLLGGARNTALQGILDSILGGDVTAAGLGQAKSAPGPREVETRMEQSWAVQLDNLKTSTSNAAAEFGKMAAAAANLTGLFSGLSNFVDNFPILSTSIALAVGTAVGLAVIVPFAQLVRAANAIIAATRVGGALNPNPPGTPGGPPAGQGPGRPTGQGGPQAPTRPTGGMRGAITAGASGLAAAGTGFMMGGVPGAIIAGIGWLAVGGALVEAIPEGWWSRARAANREAVSANEIAEAKQKVLKLDRDRAALTKRPAAADNPAVQRMLVELDRQRAEAQAKVNRLEAERQAGAPKPPDAAEKPPEEKPSETKMPTKAEFDAAIKKALGVAGATPTKPIPVIPVTPLTPEVPTPVPSPFKPKTPLVPVTPPTVAPETLTALIPQLVQSSASIVTGAQSLATSSGAFATAFSTGARSIGEAGNVAANALTMRAPGIGAIIGAAAATAISAAVSNLSIDVNANVKGGASTGPQPTND